MIARENYPRSAGEAVWRLYRCLVFAGYSR